MQSAPEIQQKTNDLTVVTDSRIHARESFLASALSRDVLPIILLVAINLVCYSRTLSGYFLADDFIHISFLHQVFSGHWELVWNNFAHNWMQAQGTQFYRPFISLTLVFDYWLGRGNPVIFHVSNTVYQIASTLFLFLLTRRLLRILTAAPAQERQASATQPLATEAADWQRQAGLAAFFAAALFAANPLHPEVVSWIIGRVDSVCSAFYLLSFWLFLKAVQDRSRWSGAFSLLSFSLSLLSKEMAVTLPLVLALTVLFGLRGTTPFKTRIADTFRLTWPFWATLSLYFIIRTLALGTIGGGYAGAIGEGLSGSFFKRWFEDQSLCRVVFPFNAEIFSQRDRLRQALSILYALSAASVFLRLVFLRRQSGLTRFVFFGGLWFVIAMLPTWQVFNLTDSLQCSRFIYLGTAPLSLMLSLLLLPVSPSYAQGKLRYVNTASIILLLCLVIISSAITYRNNLPWSHASKQVRAFREAIERQLRGMPASRKLVILNIPQRLEGAHMLYNAAMLGVLLSPPLSRENLAQRVVSFEPMTYGDSDLIVISRLRRLLADKNSYSYYFFDASQLTLVPLNLETSPRLARFDTSYLKKDLLDRKVIGATVHLRSVPLDIPAASVDFVDITLSLSPSKPLSAPPVLYLSWAGSTHKFFSPDNRLSMPIAADGQSHTYSFCVSEHKSWLKAERINALDLELPCLSGQSAVNGHGAACLDLKEVSLASGQSRLPRLAPAERSVFQGPDGICHARSAVLDFVFDASSLPAAAGTAVEISRPDGWFEHYSGTFRDRQLSDHCAKRLLLPGTKGQFALGPDSFPSAGYYEIRLAALSPNGCVTGYVSDPVNLQISPGQTPRNDH